jgi:peptidoglycan/LPS O-acetylase OafA/YrhL
MKPVTQDFKYNNFDLLRLFAALEVLLLHSFSRLNLKVPLFFEVMSNFPGVLMFFIMSGFMISASLERSSSLKKYFTNRFTRIYPALILCIIVTVVVIYFSSGISFASKEGVTWFFLQCIGIIYTPSFLTPFGFGSYNGSLWTIPLELQFYMVLPVVYFIVTRFTKDYKKQSLWLVGFFVFFSLIAFFIRLYFVAADPSQETLVQKLIRYSFMNSIYAFMFGVVMQRYKIHQKAWIYGKGLFWLVAYLIVCYLVPTNNYTFVILIMMLGITTISLAYTGTSLSHRLFHGNDISYGFYIYHGLVMGVFVELNIIGQYRYIIYIIAFTVALASLSWYLLEKPILKRKRTQVATTVAPA